MLINRPGIGTIDHDAWELDRKLREGDGVIWPGDPHLTLELAVVEARDRTTGKRHVGRRYEVWRACEDGMDRLIGHWRLDEKHAILPELARMRIEAPGHVDVVESMRAGNARVEAATRDKYRDAMGACLDHAARLLHDRTQPKTTFRQVGGRRDDS
jgi:hypothetical protein